MSGLTFKVRLLIQVCSFKLLGFKEVQQITFNERGGCKKNGEILTKIKYNDYYIEAYIPADGKIVQVNETLMADREHSILQQPKGSGWIALKVPSQPYERKELLQIQRIPGK